MAKQKKRIIYADFENVEKNAKKLRNFMYFQPKMLDPDPDSMNPDPKHCQ